MRSSKAGSWAALEREIAACSACALSGERTQVVVGRGERSARVLLLGEAPGENEDRAGEPFVGRSGRVLDEAIAAAGAARDDVYVCNAVKCRPAGNRTPRRKELAACGSFLARQVALVDPAVIVALGASAARAVQVPFEQLSQVRGAVLDGEGALRGRMIVVTYHPAYVLRDRPRRFGVLCGDLEVALRAGGAISRGPTPNW